ncbi:MAG: copper oxidase [Pedobacter sp.]|nr:MAG: copper oxidase [Pedobacter sp.]
MSKSVVRFKFLFLLWILLFNTTSSQAQQSTVAVNKRSKVYHLYLRDTVVNFSGKSKKAISVNGTIPGPALHFSLGDTAEIHVHNTMKVESSVHWHGLILPNRYDGVPYLTTAPILAGSVKIFRFPLVHSGTYWYHSHSALQEQSGLYGAFIVHPKTPVPSGEQVLLLSDWTDLHPEEVERGLHNATDWFAIKKRSTQNYLEAIKNGHLGTKVVNEWKRMLAMDVSDVYYDKLLSNGKEFYSVAGYRPGDTVRMRVINGSSSTYFWLGYGGGKMTVVANDGQEVEPVEVDRLIIGVSETYDVLVRIPDQGSYEFRATAEDRTKFTSVWLGSGTQRSAPELPRLKYFQGMEMMNQMMNMDGTMDDMGMNMSNQKMDMNRVMYPEIEQNKIKTLSYEMLRSPVATTLPPAQWKEFRFELTGNMSRYVWSINDRTVSESDKLMIKKGENVRVIITNSTMMRHPMHLHGHFFRLVNAHGQYSPLKTVLDIMPMETDTIEFAGSESGDWFFHCHILYHMISGMGRIFSYEGSAANPEFVDPLRALKKLYADDRMVHAMARLSLEHSGVDGEAMVANTRYKLQTEWRLGTTSEMGYESESHFGRYLGRMQFWFPYIGWDFRYRKMGGGMEKNIFGQSNTKDKRAVFCAGLQYLLPMLFTADARLDMQGRVRFSLMREDIPLSSRLRMSLMVNSDREYMSGLRYILTQNIAISTHFDSDMGYGAGLSFNY